MGPPWPRADPDCCGTAMLALSLRVSWKHLSSCATGLWICRSISGERRSLPGTGAGVTHWPQSAWPVIGWRAHSSPMAGWAAECPAGLPQDSWGRRGPGFSPLESRLFPLSGEQPHQAAEGLPPELHGLSEAGRPAQHEAQEGPGRKGPPRLCQPDTEGPENPGEAVAASAEVPIPQNGGRRSCPERGLRGVGCLLPRGRRRQKGRRRVAGWVR